jgi:hypothetical protein
VYQWRPVFTIFVQKSNGVKKWATNKLLSLNFNKILQNLMIGAGVLSYGQTLAKKTY